MAIGQQTTQTTTDNEGKKVKQVLEVISEEVVTKAGDATELIRNIITTRADLKEETIEDLVTLIIEGLDALRLFEEEVEEEVNKKK
jgi:uncharacterized membrane-anchored protein YhcB (DUF1043 family)